MHEEEKNKKYVGGNKMTNSNNRSDKGRQETPHSEKKEKFEKRRKEIKPRPDSPRK